MSSLTDALFCGPKATIDLIVNEAFCFVSNIAVKAAEIEKEKKQEVKEVKAEAKAEEIKEIKHEIVEFKELKEESESVLNTNFTVFDDSNKNLVTDDELNNLVEKFRDTVITRSQINLDDEDSVKHVNLIILTTLIAINKANLNEIMNNQEFNISNRDDLVEMNTIYKFYTGTRIFDSISSIQLNEFITSQLLYDVVTVIGEYDDWNMEANMSEIITKAHKRLEMESVTNGKINGLDEVDPVSPIRFDNSILNTNIIDKNSRIPRINKTTKEYIINYLTSIVPEAWIKDNDVTFELERLIDNNPEKDLGTAILRVLYKSGLAGTVEYSLDLDSIVGNGYSLAVKSMDYRNPNVIYPVYVNIEKFPEVIAKF